MSVLFALAVVGLWLTRGFVDHYCLFGASWPQLKSYSVKYRLLADQDLIGD